MALTYTWKIKNIKIKDQTNVEGHTLPKAVFQTYWEITGTDENGNSGSWSGATPFSAENVPAGSFVAFEQLTEELVLGWVKNVVNNDPSYKRHIDEQLQKSIDENLGVATEVNEKELPWAPPEDSVTPDPESVDPGIAEEGSEESPEA